MGSWSAIVLNMHKVSSVSNTPFLSLLILFLMPCQSCGYAVPLFNFKKHHTGLNSYGKKLESEDINAETDSCAISISTGPTWATSNTMAIGTIVPTEINAPSQIQSYPLTDKGYWRDQNAKSIDSLTRVTNGFKSAHQFLPNAIKAVAKVQSKDVEHVRLASVQVRRRAFQGGNKKSRVS